MPNQEIAPIAVRPWTLNGMSERLIVSGGVDRFHVGCNITRTLRERGYDARFIRGGVSAWYAAGGAWALRPAAG